MELQDILAAVREHYLGKYREAIRASREQFPLGVAELMLELNGAVAPAYRYYRIDLTGGTVDHPNFSEVNPETHQPSPARVLSYRGGRSPYRNSSGTESSSRFRRQSQMMLVFRHGRCGGWTSRKAP